jgi:hypothetical protein
MRTGLTAPLLLASLALAACDSPLMTIHPMVPDSLRIADSVILGSWRTLDDDEIRAIVVDQVSPPDYRVRWEDTSGTHFIMSLGVGRVDTLRLIEAAPPGTDFAVPGGPRTGALQPLYSAFVYTLRGDTLIAAFPKDRTWESWLRARGLQYLSGGPWITNAAAESLQAGLRALAERPDSGWAQTRFVRQR